MEWQWKAFDLLVTSNIKYHQRAIYCYSTSYGLAITAWLHIERHKKQNSGRIASECLQLAGWKKKITLVQHSRHFLICCANENMYMDKQFCVLDGSYSGKNRWLLQASTATQSCITFSIVEVHVTSPLHAPWFTLCPLPTGSMLKPAVRFRKWKGKPFCFLTLHSH